MSSKQQLFHEMLLGTLIYAVVLGFFDDYTNILATKSYSTTFALAIVLQILTSLTLLLKQRVVAQHQRRADASKVTLVLSVWLILFLSKFVFLAVIDRVFGSEVEISGFIGLMAMIVCMTVLQKIANTIDKQLAD